MFLTLALTAEKQRDQLYKLMLKVLNEPETCVELEVSKAVPLLVYNPII